MDQSETITSTIVLEEADAGPPANNTDSDPPTSLTKLATVLVAGPPIGEGQERGSKGVPDNDDEGVQKPEEEPEEVQEKENENVQDSESEVELELESNSDDGDDKAKPSEKEETPPVDVEEVRTRAVLEAQIRRLNDRIRGYEKLQRAKDRSSEKEKHSAYPWADARLRRPRRRGSDVTSVTSVSSDDYMSDGQTGGKPGEHPKGSSVTIPQLNPVPWETFYGLRSNVGEVCSPFAIDILVGDPEPEPSGKLYLAAPGRGRLVAASGRAVHHGKTPGKSASQGRALLPERIRINSSAIVRILSRIIGREANTSSPMLMMEPYRALVHYKDEIRGWKAKLEARLGNPKTAEPQLKTDKDSETDEDSGAHKGRKSREADKAAETEKTEKTAETEGQHETAAAGQDADDSKSKDDSAPAPETPAANKDDEEDDGDVSRGNTKALDDLNCLIGFIDTYLESRLAYLASNECERVTFSDIWHLFKPGDFVLGKDRKQAYRVINVKYPKHFMILPSPRDYWLFGDKVRLDDSPITIQCVYVDSDGEQIGPVPHTITIQRFEGERNILTLDIIPLRLANREGELKDKLVKRGASFIQACGTGRGGVPMHYSGLTLDTDEEVDSQVVIDFEEAFSANDGGGRNRARPGMTLEQGVLDLVAQSIIQDIDDSFLRQKAKELKWKPVIGRIDAREQDDDDPDSDSEKRHDKKKKCIPECCTSEFIHDDTYVERNRRNDFIQSQFLQQGTRTGLREPSLTIAPRPLKEAMEDENFIGDNERLITSYRVFGFIMRSRKWAKLDLTYLGPMKGENTFDLLVLPPGHRNMVESLVTQHYLDRASAADGTDEVDIVRGKGKGLILLLHGAPGVGKTTTAECVATYFHKPLFQITCGDLGSTAEVVESRLETNFALASRWGCILLIDEADVFLEARQTENFDRNSLVAVFLRTLEYYTGILFLTTNRVGTFDEAFTSRIHVSLYYPPLSRPSTLAVFRVNLGRIKARFRKKQERGVAELDLDEDSITDFVRDYYNDNADARWNGRQIRNACQTALALAEFEAQKAATGGGGVRGGRSVMEVAATSSKMITVRMAAKHFRSVAKAYLAFMKYLREVHGGLSMAQRAKDFRLRHDHWAGLGGPAPAAMGGLLASRRAAYAEKRTGGGGGGRRGQQGQWGKQGGGGRRAGQQPRMHMEEEEEEDELGGYEYDEEDVYDQINYRDPLLDEEDEDEEEARFQQDLDYQEEEERYPEEDEDDGVEFGVVEDEHPGEEDEDAEDVYEVQPKVTPQPGNGRGRGTRGRGQGQTRGGANTSRGGIAGRGRGTGTGSGTGRPYGTSERAPRGGHAPPGLGNVRGQTSAATRGRGRGRRVT